MSRLQWRYQALSVALALSLAGSAMAESDAATRLHELASSGDARGLQQLLGKSLEVDAPDKEGSTPLLVAVTQGHLDVAKRLLVHGAKVDAANRYRVTPLYVAVLHGNADMMAALLAA